VGSDGGGAGAGVAVRALEQHRVKRLGELFDLSYDLLLYDALCDVVISVPDEACDPLLIVIEVTVA